MDIAVMVAVAGALLTLIKLFADFRNQRQGNRVDAARLHGDILAINSELRGLTEEVIAKFTPQYLRRLEAELEESAFEAIRTQVELVSLLTSRDDLMAQVMTSAEHVDDVELLIGFHRALREHTDIAKALLVSDVVDGEFVPLQDVREAAKAMAGNARWTSN